MSKSKRAQIPMAPDEYAQLQRLAEQQGTSVAELVRKAVWDRYFIPTHRDERKHALADLLSLQPIPVDDWSIMKKELGDRYGSAFP